MTFSAILDTYINALYDAQRQWPDAEPETWEQHAIKAAAEAETKGTNPC